MKLTSNQLTTLKKFMNLTRYRKPFPQGSEGINRLCRARFLEETLPPGELSGRDS